jgi:formiminotetrahydrofolate cyclodeaminase
MAMSAIEGAGYNVKINLTSISDKAFVDKMTADTNSIIDEGHSIAAVVKQLVESNF